MQPAFPLLCWVCVGYQVAPILLAKLLQHTIGLPYLAPLQQNTNYLHDALVYNSQAPVQTGPTSIYFAHRIEVAELIDGGAMCFKHLHNACNAPDTRWMHRGVKLGKTAS